MPDFPRLREPLLLSLLAALCWILALRGDRLPDWLRMVLTAWGLLFTTAALVTAANWLAYNASVRLKDYHLASVYPASVLAQALRGLTPGQTDIVARHDVVALVGLLGADDGPVFT